MALRAAADGLNAFLGMSGVGLPGWCARRSSRNHPVAATPIMGQAVEAQNRVPFRMKVQAGHGCQSLPQRFVPPGATTNAGSADHGHEGLLQTATKLCRAKSATCGKPTRYCARLPDRPSWRHDLSLRVPGNPGKGHWCGRRQERLLIRTGSAWTSLPTDCRHPYWAGQSMLWNVAQGRKTGDFARLGPPTRPHRI